MGIRSEHPQSALVSLIFNSCRMTRFEKSNEMLVNCNALSSTRFQNGELDFKKHTQMLTEMRKDVDNIFRRIRAIKAKLASQYPKQYEGKQPFYCEIIICILILDRKVLWDGSVCHTSTAACANPYVQRK